MARLLLVLLCLGTFTAQGAGDALTAIRERKEMRIGLQAGYVPFAMRKPDGSYVGFEIEMMRAFAQTLGAKAVFVDTRWEGIIPALHAGKFDAIVSGMTITPERAKAVRFSDPYYEAGLQALVAKKHEGKITSMAALDTPGRTVAVQIGTTGDFYAGRTFKKARVVKLDLESDAANAVLLGKLDAFIFDAPFLQLFLRRHPGKAVLLPERLSEEGLGLAVRPKDTALVEAFNRWLGEWKKSGARDRIARTYFEEMSWLKEFPQLMQ